MPQLNKSILLVLLCIVLGQQAYSQCGTLAINSVNVNDVSCNGGSNGSITVNITGGIGPFTYANGASSAIGGSATFGTSSTLSTSTSGTLSGWWSPGNCTDGSWVYSSTNGCPAGAARFNRSVAFAGCFLRSPQLNMNGVNTVTITMDVSHSYDPARPNDRARFYCWVNNSYPGVPTTVNGVSTNILNFNQARNCQTITVTLDLSSVPSGSRSDFLFYIETDCQYSLCASYFMEVDNIQFSQGSAYQSSNTFTNLPAGNYPITVRDANGCTLTYANNPVVVSQPTALGLAMGATSPTTIGGNNGRAWARVTGGTSPVSYSWSPVGVPSGSGDTITNLTAGNYCVTVTDANGCTISDCINVTAPSCNLSVASVGKTNTSCVGINNGGFSISTTGANGTVEYSINGGSSWQTSNVFSGLAPGNYTIQVRDAAGCTASATGNPQVITAPQIMSLNFAPTPVSTVGGADGAINLIVTGGASPRGYQWNNGANSEDLTNLAAGQYCVTVTDNNGCTVTGCGNVTQPTCNLAVTSVAANSPSCNGSNNGTIIITASGANGAVEYSVNGGSTWQASNSFSGLAPGSYTVQVRDAAGCTANGPANPYTLTQPAAIGLSFATTPVSTVGGADGAVNLTVTGASTPITYAWNNSASTEDLTNLPAGNYCVTVTAANGCSATGCATVGQPGCNLAISNVSKMDIACSGGTGNLTIATTGGAGQVEYSINGGSSWSNSGSFLNLVAGSYTVQVRDGNGCTATAANNPYQFTSPSAINLNTVVTNVSTAGGNDGAIDLTATGGTPPFTFMWNTGQSTEDLANLSAGTYCVTATDANGCTATNCATVTSPTITCAGFSISNVATVQPVCPGETGSITISISGGQNPILYSVDSGATFQNGVSLFSVSGGTYDILVRDNNGCEAVYANNPVIINTPQSLNPVINQSGFELSVNDIGVSYEWQYGGNPIANTDTTAYTAIANGVYTVVVTDANGCEFTSAPITITGVGINDVVGLEWNIWPNPAEGVLQYSVYQTHNARLELWSADGRLVMQHTITQNEGSLDLNMLSAGVYNVRLVTALDQSIKRVVKY